MFFRGTLEVMSFRSIRTRILLATWVPLVVVIGVYAAASYHEMERSAMTAARERLLSVTGQLGELLAQAARQRRNETLELAHNAALAAYLQHPTDRSREAALTALRGFRDQSAAVIAVELWDLSSRRLLSTRNDDDSPLGDTDIVRPLLAETTGRDDGAVSPIATMDESLSYAVVATVSDSRARVGSVVQRRALVASTQAGQQITDLIGSGARLFLGNSNGGLWTDLRTVTDGPPVDLRRAKGVVEYRRGRMGVQMAAGQQVRDTPWTVLVEFPRSEAVARTRGLVGGFALLGVVLLSAGSAAAWALGRGITHPLSQLARGAEAISRGDYRHRVSVDRADELGALARAFDTMASSVEQAHRGLEQNFQLLVDRVVDYAIFMLDPEGHVITWNDGAARLKGYHRDEILGRHFSCFYTTEDIAAGKPHRLLEVAATEGRVEDENWRIRKDGSRLWANVVLTALRDQQGTLLGFGKVMRDLTERRRAEEVQRDGEKRLALYASALEATNAELASFSYSVSHDLRAPLRTMDGFAQALLEDYADRLDNVGKDYLGRIRAASQRMAALIDDLLALSRVTRAELKHERVDLSALAGDVIDELRQSAPNRSVDVAITPGLATAGDRRLLRLVLQNLLGNAWKFTGTRSHARIEFGRLEREPTYFVRDDGAGFDMTYADKLFGAFQRLHSPAEFEGTGIGLATVQRIVGRHGGRVWAQGEVDRGATFYFTLGGERA